LPLVPPQSIEGVWIHGVRVSKAGVPFAPARPFPGRILRTVAIAA